MKQGDFSELAKAYINRAGYSHTVLNVIGDHIGAFSRPSFFVADVGAGTGKLTLELLSLKLRCVAVEPNDQMRAEGIRLTSESEIEWLAGSGEETGLPTASVDWLLMASSFHWVDTEKGLREFHRVLKPGGHFTALWNPRDLKRSELHMRIERKIEEIVPDLRRVSSGSAKYTENAFRELQSTGQFSDCFYVEAKHDVVMSKERYMGAWRSVNDIQAQAGPERFQEILRAIEREIADLQEVVVPYATRAYTARRVD